MTRRRYASYVRTLVYMDEPQLMLLKSVKTNIIAVAVPGEDAEALFFATTVSPRNLEAYLEGSVDLRFLFTFPTNRSLYTFDLMKMEDDRVALTAWDGNLKEEFLPAARFFSFNHTEDDDSQDDKLAESEKLLVDGEWDMPEFGSFYNRYSDIYYFVSATESFVEKNASEGRLKAIKRVFTDLPFKGGSSYVHFFDTLPTDMPRRERLRMDKIKYESPGYVSVNGDRDVFNEVEYLISNYLQRRSEIREHYTALYKYLSNGKFLQMAGGRYETGDATAPFISKQAVSLALAMKLPNIDAVVELVEGNALVLAKVILAFYRRLEDTSRFFAQGRVNFDKAP